MSRLSLEACLERLAQMEQDYILTDRGHHRTVPRLLEVLRQRSPTLLAQPVYVRLPSPAQPGAIAQLDGHGGFCVIYRIEEYHLTTALP